MSLGVPLAVALVVALLGRLAARLLPRRPSIGVALLRAAGPLAVATLTGAAGVVAIPDLPAGQATVLTWLALTLVLGALAAWRPWIQALYALGVVVSLPWRTPAPPPSAPPTTAAAGPSVVLLTLDTFRADHLGAIGGYVHAIATPNLDAIAARGRLHTEGVATVPLTLPSHTTMLTGEDPWHATVLRNGDHLPEGATVVPTLHAAGYRTAAFVSAAVLASTSGLDAGFDHYDDHFTAVDWVAEATVPRALARGRVGLARTFQRRGDATLDRVERWLATAEGPYFLWVHLYDPHSPYDPPPPYSTMYARDPALAPPARRKLDLFSRVFEPRDIPAAVARYEGEITWTDTLVGRLVAALPADTRLVVAGDHGESLTEHDYYLNHGQDLHQPSIHVPILVAGPGVAPARVDTPTPLLRVAPTLLALAGLPAGPSLLDPPPAEILSYAPAQQSRLSLDPDRPYRVAWRTGPEKWIVDGKGGTERYDLAADPDELTNTATDHPAAPAYASRGARFLEEMRAVEKQQPADRSPEELEALEALGYVDP